MSTATYVIAGMSCQHCIDAVTAEVGRIGGVEQVDVDLTSGVVRVTSTAPLRIDEVRSAVDEAGYDLFDEPQTSS